MNKIKIIIVEDSFLTVELIKESLSGKGYDVAASVSNSDDALNAIHIHNPDLVLMDINIQGDMDGITCTKIINERFGIPVIYLAAFADGKIINRAMLTEAYGCVMIPFREMELLSCIEIALDTAKRKRYVDELKTVQEDTINLINSLTSIVIGVSIHDVITHWNPAAESTFGIPSTMARGIMFTQLLINWDWILIYEGIYQSIVDNAPKRLDDVHYTKPDGVKRLLGITITPIKDSHYQFKGFIIQASDITDRRLMERQLQQSGKMAVIGEIATGVAHELNQPLNVIKMASQFLLDGIANKYSTEEFIIERLNKIIIQVDRAAKIINHLREFGRKSDLDFKAIDPNIPIRMAFDMLGEQLRIRSISVKVELDDNLPAVYGDAASLEQVYINLIINSRDALGEMKNSLHEKIIHVKSYFDTESRSVCVKFSDNGPGIPSDIISKVFDPFFTTKEVGKGTGLGLSISYGIIKSHKGTIDVSSDGQGAVFTITIPVTGIVPEEKH